MKRNRITAILIGASLAATIGGQAFAAESTLSAAVIGDTLSFNPAPANVSFGSHVLNGRAFSMAGQISNFGVIDARGTGAGWAVQVVATQFTDAATGNTLPAGSLTLGGGSVALDDPTSATAPTWVYLGDAIDGSTTNGVNIVRANIDEGMGSYIVSQGAMTLSLPASVKAGAYSATLYATLAVAP